MVGSSKILTVSYGTFSCTLEGFDDPFSTMKSIAEYFRDLAADDRYFGAEPPTPDAEMLHRIAEREVQRRVETRLTSGGITLRQTEDAPGTPERVEPAAELAAPETPRTPERDERAVDHADEAVAAKLSRIRAVVDRARARSMPSPAAPAFEPAELEDEPEDADLSDITAARRDQMGDALATGMAADELDEGLDENEVEAADAGDEIVAGTPDEEPEERVAEDSLEDDGAPDEDEPVHAASGDEDDAFEGTDRPWADTMDGEDQPAVAEDDAEEPVEAAVADEPGIAEEPEMESPVAMDEDEADEDAPSGAYDDEEEDDLADRIVRLSQTGHRSGLLSDDDEDNQPEDDETLAGIRMALETEQQAIAQEKKEQRLERRHVLIGGDPDQGPAFNRILAETDSKLADREGTRRRSAIAHLKAAVAATKADRMLNRERSRQLDEEEQSAYREDLAKVVRPHRSEPRESAADKMRRSSEPAEPLILGSSQRVDDAGGAERVTSVQPRRIGAGMLAIESEDADVEGDDDSAFVAFAEEMGARELPDLLEAAAAYTAFVERQPHFSRPQIMRRAAAIETEEEFTREAGLRSFGQLLRQGKIRKLQRGQFTISENTRFRPEARIAGE